MQRNLFKICILVAFITCCKYGVYAQKTDFDSQNALYRKAMELFEKEKYVAAQHYFQKAATEAAPDQLLEKENASYFAILCAMELFHDDTEMLTERFISNYPESPYINIINLKLALYEYGKKKYKPALEYFAQVKKEELTEEQNAEYYFKSGYSWFLIDSLDKARKAFYEIKDIDTRYTPASIYYYSHIAYLQKNYETAIAGFNKLRDDETFSPLVSYYITQCYYYQEKYDLLLSYAPALIDSVVETRRPEMAKMIGDAYYRKEMYKEAIPYYARYFDSGKDFKPEDYFQAGYSYYMISDYASATPMFEKASLSTSAMAQHANYLLGDCYIRLKQKDKALLAFGAASNMDFVASIKEDALFNYAVLTYELSNSPFNSSIKALNDYIQQYPDSRRSDEAYNYLITACLNTRNYQEAITHLGKIKNKDKNIKKAYQRAAFFRGLELFNNLQFDEAKTYFDLSLRNADSDPLIAARTYYWLGESDYRKQNIDEAMENYQLFVASKEAEKCSENNIVSYNIAYCQFSHQQYVPAADGFNKFLSIQKNKKSKLVADAYNRLADCSFAAGKYKDAISFFDKSIEIGLADKDYAMFQKAFALGLTGEHRKKISLLAELLSKHPESGYCDDAVFEQGRAYVALQQPKEATQTFNDLIKNYPSSSYVKKAMLQLGLIAYNAGKNTEAIEKYKQVVAAYPNTNEARNALTGIKNIYLEMNDADAYLAYAETLGSFANVSAAEKDSLSYYAAEGLYTSGNWKKAKPVFKKYIDTYPQGNFILNAWYYKADCHYKDKEMGEALEAYNKVIAIRTNDFTEPALVATANINMSNKDYNAALANYQKLDSVAEIDQNRIDARMGVAVSRFNLLQYAEAIEAAQKVLKTTGTSQEIERKARYIQAKSLIASGDANLALEPLKKLASDVKNVEGAEAKYLLAKVYFDQKQMPKAEKEIFNFIDLNSPHQYWMAKAFILLAEIYYSKKDEFQAINTLQSIISNYSVKDDGIIDEAKMLKLKVEGKTNDTQKPASDTSGTGEDGL